MLTSTRNKCSLQGGMAVVRSVRTAGLRVAQRRNDAASGTASSVRPRGARTRWLPPLPRGAGERCMEIEKRGAKCFSTKLLQSARLGAHEISRPRKASVLCYSCFIQSCVKGFP